jgi:hypothetical protein
MFKLTAAIRNHFVVFPYIEAKASPSTSARRVPAPITERSRILSRFSGVAVPNPLAASRARLRPSEIEAMTLSHSGIHLPTSTPPLLPDSASTSLAGKAPTVCSQLLRMREGLRG